MGAHASDQSAWWRRVATLAMVPLRVALHPYGAGLAFGLLVGTMLALVLAHDMALARGLPREHVVALSVKERHGAFFDGCGKGSSRQTVRWHSENPPAGLPATFVHERCGDVSEGDRETVVRTEHGTDLVVDPPTSWGEVGTTWLAMVVVGGVGGVLIMGVTDLWRWAFRGRRRRPTSAGRHER